MPATSLKQKKLMDAAAHNPSFAKKVGIPSKVAKEFSEASKGQKFGRGGVSAATSQGVNKPKTDHGAEALFSKGGNMATKMNPKMMAAMMQKKKASPPTSAPSPDMGGLGAMAGPGGMSSMSGMKSGGMTAMKKGGMSMAAFEKSGKDIEKKGVREGSKADMAMDKKQMSAMKRGGSTKRYASGGMTESEGPRNMGSDVEKGSNTKRSHGEHGIQKKGFTKATQISMPGNKGMKRGGKV